jgi:hypothetical protein
MGSRRCLVPPEAPWAGMMDGEGLPSEDCRPAHVCFPPWDDFRVDLRLSRPSQADTFCART